MTRKAKEKGKKTNVTPEKWFKEASTPEKESVESHIKAISVDTGVNFYKLLETQKKRK